MTHEELLAKISKQLRYCTCEGSGWGGNNCFYDENQGWIALRAVVELHKSDGNFCVECSHDVDYLFNYPCKTIQVVEEHLK